MIQDLRGEGEHDKGQDNGQNIQGRGKEGEGNKRKGREVREMTGAVS
jgi:hypothetical protein